jgi:hypothetical protein
MSLNTFTLHTTLQAAPESVIDFLMQPENYVGLQPFMVSSRLLERGTDAHGRAFVHYAAVEGVPILGSLRMNTPLDVVSTVVVPGAQMVSLVSSSFNVRVEFRYDFQRTGDQTHLTLTVTVQAPFWTRGLVLARAKEAQTTLLKKLSGRF